MFGEQKRPVSAILVALATVVALAVLCPVATEAKFTIKDKVNEKETKLQIYGFSQLEMRGGKGWDLRTSLAGGDGPMFAAQRIRWGMNYFHGPIAGKLFIDFNQIADRFENVPIDTDDDGQFDDTNRQWLDAGGLPLYIKDAFVAYRVNNAFMIRLGMIKTPLGMDFTVPGWNLDIVQRGGLEKALVLERDMGLTISGRLIGQSAFGGKEMKTNGLEMGAERQGRGFGYDFFVGNPAGRSVAVVWDRAVLGDALSYVGRVHFDWDKMIHTELAYGISELAGGIDAPLSPAPGLAVDDYKVLDFGIASEILDSKLELKYEYIAGDGIRGETGRKQMCHVLTAGWLFVPSAQLVVKTYQAEHERVGSPTTDLGNTYVGFNWFLARVSEKHRDLQRHKVVFNYIFTNGDDINSDTQWNGLTGYRDTAYLLQWQFKY
jgi:hypothetical protein